MVLNFVPGTIFHMDNLDALRGMNSATVDLIATDPPFNTGRNREGKGGKYPDQWRWGEILLTCGGGPKQLGHRLRDMI